MTDITLEDLAGSGGGTDEQDADGGGGGGEWVGKLFDRLDDKGYLDAIIAQQFDVDTDMTQPDETADDGETGSIDAETVAQFGKMVIDQVGDVPMSEVVKYCESNPAVVNNIIQQATGDE